MMDLDESLSMLQCPETGAPLARLDEELLDELNSEIGDGTLRDVSGAPVERTLDAALRPEDADFVYPVRGDIPNFLLEDRIPLSEIDSD